MTRSRLHIFILAIVFIVAIGACKKTTAPVFHTEYFGLTEGRYVIYDVVDITHDKALGLHETLHYQLKTHWGQPYIDNEGRNAREFQRYVRNTSSDPWVFSDLWTGIIDGIRAELIEENQRVVKLVFAPTYQKEWDANGYNVFGELDCYYSEIHEDKIIGGTNFDSTLIVEQEDYNNLIDSVRMYEIYAKHVGLVYHHFKDNHYQFGSPEVVKGNELYFTYSSSGFE